MGSRAELRCNGRAGYRALAAAVLIAMLAFSARAQQYGFHIYGVEEGLQNLAVKVIFQDRTEFLWAATESGVYRFDGVRFRRFGPDSGLPHDVIMSLGEAPGGTMLAGSQSGLFRLQRGVFHLVTLPESAVISTCNSIRYDGRGRTCLATNKGLLAVHAPPDGDLRIERLDETEGTFRGSAQGLFFEGSDLWYGCGAGLCRHGRGSTSGSAKTLVCRLPQGGCRALFRQSGGARPGRFVEERGSRGRDSSALRRVTCQSLQTARSVLHSG
ncbi:MAG: hypothetical protein KGN84_21785 [Acidobacteriota bacterium]|nr:hypothetical protein [Acidobacteriota bacterium]